MLLTADNIEAARRRLARDELEKHSGHCVLTIGYNARYLMPIEKAAQVFDLLGQAEGYCKHSLQPLPADTVNITMVSPKEVNDILVARDLGHMVCDVIRVEVERSKQLREDALPEEIDAYHAKLDAEDAARKERESAEAKLTVAYHDMKKRQNA